MLPLIIHTQLPHFRRRHANVVLSQLRVREPHDSETKLRKDFIADTIAAALAPVQMCRSVDLEDEVAVVHHEVYRNTADVVGVQVGVLEGDLTGVVDSERIEQGSEHELLEGPGIPRVEFHKNTRLSMAGEKQTRARIHEPDYSP